jgi:lipopolysaccharide transport system ATP-binding protein
MSDLAISARGLSKRYRRSVRGHHHDSLRDVIEAGVEGIFASEEERADLRKRELFWALQDIDFDIRRGENVGVIGFNGAGKSTLLKILSRITAPTTGTVRITGRLGALLELGTGFHPELSGRENVFLSGAILGMTREQVCAKFDAIVDFAEIEDFIDTPVKRYSSGMYVRLAFAVAAHLNPDILLLDELLAVGDFAFQRKCVNFLRKLEEEGATIMFVSHNLFTIRTMCERVIYLRKGRIVFDGAPEEGLRLYEKDSVLQDLPWFYPPGEQQPLKITGISVASEAGGETNALDFGDRMRVRVAFRALRRIERPDFRIAITRVDEVNCATFSTSSDEIDIPAIEGEGVVELLTPPLRLNADRYSVRLLVRERQYGDVIAAQVGGAFDVRHPTFVSAVFGVLHERGDWRVA